jgi:hypothetical protein
VAVLRFEQASIDSMHNETFFHRNSKFLGLGRQFGQINIGAFGVFLADLSAPILAL